MKSDGPTAVMRWENQTGRTIHYGEYFEVYRKGLLGIPVKCQTMYPVGYNDLLYAMAGESAEREFSLKAYDLSSEGEYTIRFTFYLDEEKDVTYTGNLDFRVGKVKTDGYTEYDGVDVRVKELVLEGEFPYVMMEWVNLSGQTVGYGLLHDLYYRRADGTLERCVREPEIMYDFILFKTAGVSTQYQDLYGWDCSKAGTYVVTFDFQLEGEEWPLKHNGYLEFTVP